MIHVYPIIVVNRPRMVAIVLLAEVTIGMTLLLFLASLF
jgi:hypothetical protein